jgi:hypothetical protein
MSRVSGWLVALVCSAGLMWAATPAWAQAEAEQAVVAEQLLPAETVLFLSIPDVPAFVEAYKTTSMGRLLADESVQPFLEELQKKGQELAVNAEEQLGVSMSDIQELPQGEITFAVVAAPEVAPLLIVDTGDRSDTINTLLEKMDAALKDAGCEHETMSLEDVEAHVYKLPDSDDIPIKHVAYFLHDGYLVFSTEGKVLEAVIKRWNGGDEPTLADAPVFKYIQEQCAIEGEESQFKWYLDLVGSFQAGVRAVQAEMPQANLALTILPLIGLDKLKGMGGSGSMMVGDFDSISKSFIYVEQPVSGLLGMMQFGVAEQRPPSWVHDDVVGYSSFLWNVEGAYQSLESIVDSFQGPGALEKAMEQASTESGTDLNLKQDLIDQLTGEIHLVTEANADGENALGAVPRMVFSLGLKDGSAMQTTLSKLAETEGLPVEVSELGGVSVYSVQSEENAQSVSLAVVGNTLVITTGDGLMEHVVQPPKTMKKLVESDEYDAIAAHFPKKTSMVGFGQQGPQLKAMYDLLKQQDGSELGIDLSTLPEWDSIEKYFGSTGMYIVPGKMGASWVQFSLKMEE